MKIRIRTGMMVMTLSARFVVGSRDCCQEGTDHGQCVTNFLSDVGDDDKTLQS